MIAAVWLVAMAVATPAAAEGARSRSDLRFEVVGEISPRCGLTQSSRTVSFGQLLDGRTGGNTAARLDLDFAINCNTPFQLTLASAEGGLALSEGVRGDREFRRRIDYSADITLPSGARGLRGCASTDMAARDRDRAHSSCTLVSPDHAVVAGAGKVTLAVDADARPILAGRYSDTLTLRMTPTLGGEEPVKR